MILGCVATVLAAGHVCPAPDGDADASEAGTAPGEDLAGVPGMRRRGERQAGDVVFARTEAAVLGMGAEQLAFAERQIAAMSIAVQRDPAGGRRVDP